LLQQSASGLGIDQNLQRHRAVSLRQHGFLVFISVSSFANAKTVSGCFSVLFQFQLYFTMCDGLYRTCIADFIRLIDLRTLPFLVFSCKKIWTSSTISVLPSPTMTSV